MNRKVARISNAKSLVPAVIIERRIYMIRGQKVMLDADLAGLYQVETSNLNKAVKRNLDRFPIDFMFQLTRQEAESLRFQTGISNGDGRGGRRYLPYVFTEHGVAMLSSVLNSARAVQINILIIRAFMRLREMLASHKDLARKIERLEMRQKKHGDDLAAVCRLIVSLIETPEKPKRAIGFRAAQA